MHEASYAEIAARMGMRDKAVALRLSRGKRLLRHVLITDFRQDAAAYGFLGGDTDGWQRPGCQPTP